VALLSSSAAQAATVGIAELGEQGLVPTFP
jgi:hypothetical protein